MKRLFSFFETTLLNSWWTIAILLACLFLWEQNKTQTNETVLNLTHDLETIQARIQKEKNLQEDLKLQIASQQDRDWIEQVLIKRIGVVPEGWVRQND